MSRCGAVRSDPVRPAERCVGITLGRQLAVMRRPGRCHAGLFVVCRCLPAHPRRVQARLLGTSREADGRGEGWLWNRTVTRADRAGHHSGVNGHPQPR